MEKFRLQPTHRGGKAVSVLFLLLSLSIGLVHAQSRLRTGHVVDENGKPLAGVSVTIKGHKGGTTTDQDGNFTLQTTGPARLVFSMVGYANQEVNADAAGTVALTASHTIIDSVVVVGYGTMR
ncbi:MAG TPA: carboxypeptidase-like regulatory domain-containing protein, partial [Puia sp.]|nr:carboxypeptidase-like regulatory domain-containing protein [Puia sp.]